MTSTRLMVRLARQALNLTDCISFKLIRDRFTPYTRLSGEWYCPKETQPGEILTVMFYIDGNAVHIGMPCGSEIIRRDEKTVLKLDSKSYSSLLLLNQCPDGLIPDINLEGLVKASGIAIPNTVFQTDTPTVNYVNYYDGTSLWDGIVCYSIRAGGTYPYLSGYNQIRISPQKPTRTVEISDSNLIYHSSATDYSRIISKISMRSIDGEGGGYSLLNHLSPRTSIVRNQELPFDRKWIMDPDLGLKMKIDYSMRGLNCDKFGVLGYISADLLDSLSVPVMSFSATVSAITVSGSPKTGIITEFRCDHDSYSA